ncbi:hypothetical protein C8F04DRAFT_1179533 [Mycena alexandri]|uniref:Uncharacterized protein n=1 Tax=Mycena alexandri TaxID=1745969 RepID=A0AAD6T4X0_9AGAR|nr:hypothetical protein C8F04DRAFT_1179533 [Mycena alexandri]
MRFCVFGTFESVRSSDCQEFTDSKWGQITNLTIMLNPAGGETQGLLVGTGRGMVSIYPWHERTICAATNTVVFFDAPVESQAFDAMGSSFVAASQFCTVKMYAIRDCSSSIPRRLEFMGEENETFIVHTLTTGTVRIDVRVAATSGRSRFCHVFGGQAAEGCPQFEHRSIRTLGPTDSDPFPISPFGTSRKIKGTAFGEIKGVRNIICGGDDGTIYVYNIPNHEIEQELIQADYGTICALTTCSTRDYHLISSAAGELPAHVYIWGKPTQRRHTEDMEQELERQRFEAQVALDAATLAQSRQEAESLRAE